MFSARLDIEVEIIGLKPWSDQPLNVQLSFVFCFFFLTSLRITSIPHKENPLQKRPCIASIKLNSVESPAEIDESGARST